MRLKHLCSIYGSEFENWGVLQALPHVMVYGDAICHVLGQVYSLQKQIVCFNHRVVTLVADKQKRQWLCTIQWRLQSCQVTRAGDTRGGAAMLQPSFRAI